MRKPLIILIFSLFMISCERPTETELIDDSIPPSIPIGLFVYRAFDGLIDIEWQRNNEADLDGYKIYRKVKNSEYEYLDFTTNNYYVNDSLDYDKTYYYKVSSIDIYAHESELSSEVSATPLNINAPKSPTDLTINARNWENNISIYLNWFPNSESDVAGYNIYRSTSSSFEADSSTFLDFTDKPNYSDTNSMELYKNFYYKITAVDKGKLESDPGQEIYDFILEIPEIVFPLNNFEGKYFNHFIVKSLEVNATYKIVLQENQFFGEVWSKQLQSETLNDSLKIDFNFIYFDLNRKYYWRIITYSGFSSEPNSISELYTFTIRDL